MSETFCVCHAKPLYCRTYYAVAFYNKINLHTINFQVSGILHNTGQSLVFRVDKDTKQHVNISGGPLAYRYQFEEIYIHYGTENSQGSEHHIQGYSFPGEVSFFTYNSFFVCVYTMLLCVEYVNRFGDEWHMIRGNLRVAFQLC